MAEGEVHPTSGEPDRGGEGSRGRGFITCAACESVLHSSGDVKRKSDSLKAMEKAEDDLRKAKEQIEALTAECDALRAERNPTPAPAPAERKPHFSLTLD